MKGIKVFLVLVFSFLIAFEGFGISYYYYENFSNGLSITNNGWQMNTLRGKSGIFKSTTNSSQLPSNDPSGSPWNSGGAPSAQTVGTASGVTDPSLIIYGRGNNCQLTLNNYFAGNGIKFIPVSNTNISRVIVAKPEEPFGFTVVRRMARVDNLSDARGQSLYHKSYVNVWIAEENYKTNEWDNYDNFVVFYEGMVGGNTSSEWGFYRGGLNNFNFASGVFTNYWGDTTNFSYLRVNMQDSNPNYLNMNFYGGNAGTSYANTNVIGLKITHDGTKVTFYLNPAPYSATGSWYKVGETPVAWYSNLVVEFGNDSLIFVSEAQEAYWDDFTIRTVTSNTVAYITPSKVVKNSTNIYTIVISNDITTSDSGVGEIKITKPADFGAWDTNSVWVENNYITGANTNNRVFSGEPAQNQFLVRVDPSDPNSLLIRFKMTAPSGIIDSSVANKTIKVSFRLITPSTPDVSGNYKFSVYVDCNKEPGTPTTINYATTGWKKSYEVGTGLSTKVYDDPYMYAGLSFSPTPMYEGNSVYEMIYDFSTSGLANRPDLGVVEILMPNGFVVSNYYESIILGSLANTYITQTNYNGTNRIRINYASAGYYLPGQNGLERIKFYVTQTPDLPIGVRTSNFVWPQMVYDKFGTSRYLIYNTNATYPRQNTLVVIPSPQPFASVSPPKIDNAVKTNTLTYTVVNYGPTGNDIIKLFILFDTNFITNYVWGLSNKNLPANIYSTNISGLGFGVFVDYTNASNPLKSGSNDVIYFTTIHKRTNVDDPPTNVPFVVYGDNGNTEGLVAGDEYSPNSWSVLLTPPEPEGVAYISPTNIDTTTIVFTVTNYLYNTGAIGNNMKKGRIAVPSGFSILSVQSSYITNDAANISILPSNIILHYDNDNGIGLKSVYDTGSPFDIIVITLSNTNYFTPTILTMQNYVSNARGETNCGDKGPNEKQNLGVDWPPLNASIAISPTELDSSTYTNDITVIISNLGSPLGSGNYIYRVVINVPSDVSTNIFNIQSAVINNDGANARFISTPTTNYILLDYISDGTNIVPGGRDVITFSMVDIVELNKLATFNTVASNQKAFQLITNGNSSIYFKMPHAYSGAKFDSEIVYTSSTPTNVNLKLIITNAGKGSNRLYRVKVNIPSVYQGKILLAQSSIVGTTGVSLTSSNFTINYINFSTNLPAGMVDEVMLMFSNTYSVPTNGQFVVFASNGSLWSPDGWEQGTNIIYSADDGYLYISEQPKFVIDPTNISTFQNTNTFTIYLTNGINSNSRDIYRMVVRVPSIFSITNFANQPPTSLSSMPTLSTNGNDVIINFASDKLSGGKYHTITITVTDNFNYGETNVNFVVMADYNDGYSNNNFGYSVGGNGNVKFYLPPSKVWAKLVPNDVYYDIVSTPMRVELTNYGEKYNDVYWAKIFLPPVVTNVTILSNKIPANLSYIPAENSIFVNYSVSNTNIPSTKYDVVYFIGHDNQDLPGYVTNITVNVANYPSNVYYTNATEKVADDLEYNVVVPPYQITYRVEPNDVPSFVNDFVTYKVFVDNIGNAGNNLERLEIVYPSILVTNTMSISTTYTNPTISIVSDRIVIDYTGKELPPGTNDIITIVAKDNWLYGETNVYFYAKAMFNTSLGQIVNGKVSGGTNLVRFLDSPPYVYAKLEYNEVYYSNPNPSINLILSNGGSGDNIVKSVSVNIPSRLQIGFSASKASSALATNITYSSGVLTLMYSNFVVGAVDTVTLSLSNTNSVGSSAVFSGSASNAITNGAILEFSPQSLQLSFISVPNAENLTNEIDTLKKTNVIAVRINNDTAGSISVKGFMISLPWPFINVAWVSNTKPATISVSNGTNIYVWYTDGVVKGDGDTIVFGAVDTFEFGNTNAGLSFYVSEGIGFVPASIGFGGTNINIKMPKAQGYASLITKYVYISVQSGVTATNTVRMYFTNTGGDFNNIRFVKVVFPAEITNFISNSTTLGGNVISNSNNVLFIQYTNDGIPSLGVDGLSVTFEENYPTKVLKRLYVYYDNGYGELQSIDPPADGTLDLLFDYPQEASEVYIVKDSDVTYTIDTNHTIVMRLMNNSYSYPIRKVRINYDSSNYIITKISLSNYTLASWVTNSSNIILDLNIPTRRAEYIAIDVLYSASTNITNNLSTSIFYDGAEDYEAAKVPVGETVDFKILYANFGRVLGLVKPYSSDISVKVVYPGTENVVVDNVKSNNIMSSLTLATNVSYIDVGSYRLDFVPPGTYDVLITSGKYRKFVINNVSVVPNKITNLDMVVLSNAPFSTEAREEQSVVSFDDGRTALIVPPGSLLNDFSVDIIIRNATGVEQSGVNNSKGAGKFNSIDSMKVYELVMKTVPGQDIFENPLKDDVVLKFYYNESYISSQGWNEDNISIWYWKDTTKEWVRIGGKVDKDNNFIYIKTRYLHRVYAIIGDGDVKKDGVVRNVRFSPNPFTPVYNGSSIDYKYGMLKLTFDLDKPYDKYYVKIYDMRGQLMRVLEGDGSYGQGEVYWDGKDYDGVYVRNGVYVFAVVVDGKIQYKGTVVLIK